MSELHPDNAIDILNEYKKSRLQRTFDTVAQILVVIFFSLLIYYNGLMLMPHITPICWAVLWALFLNRPLQIVTSSIQWADAKIARYKLSLYILTALIYSSTFFTASLLTITVSTLIFSVWSFLLWGDRSTVSVLLLLSGGLLLLGLPVYVIARSCVEESSAIAIKIRDFVEKNPQFQTLLNDFGNSPYYKWAFNYAASWGVELPEFDVAEIKDRIIALGMQFSSHFTDALGGVVGVLSDGVRMLVSFLTFSSALFYLLQSSQDITGLLSDLSPFSQEDTVILMNSLNRSVVSVFLSSFFVGLSHFLGTYLVFWFLSVDLALILSLISGFTAMLPIVGSWIVWLPIAVGMGLNGAHISCLIVVLVQLLLQGPVDGLIYSTIPGNSFMVGMALAMGIYVFGTLGVILGPLLTGLCVTICDIYRTYQNSPHIQASSPHLSSAHHHYTANRPSVHSKPYDPAYALSLTVPGAAGTSAAPNTGVATPIAEPSPKSYVEAKQPLNSPVRPVSPSKRRNISQIRSPPRLGVPSFSQSLGSSSGLGCSRLPSSPYTDIIACEIASPTPKPPTPPPDHSFMARLSEAIVAAGPVCKSAAGASEKQAEDEGAEGRGWWDMRKILGILGINVEDENKLHQS